MGTDTGNPHRHVPNFIWGVVVSLLIGLAVLGVWLKLTREQPDASSAETYVESGEYDSARVAIDELMTQAHELVAVGEEEQAAKMFGDIRFICRNARTRIAEAQEKAEKKAQKSEDDIPQKKREEYPFSIREADACHYLAALLFKKLDAEMGKRSAAARPAPPPDQVERIEKILNEGLAANQENRHLHRMLGVLYNLTARYASAEKELLTAISLEDKFAEAHNDLGLVYVNMRLFDKAREQFNLARVLSQDIPSTHAAALLNLGRFHADLFVFHKETGNKDGSDEKEAAHNREQAIKNLEEYMQAPDLPADTDYARETLKKLKAAAQ
jgi:hypothetical protein